VYLVAPKVTAEYFNLLFKVSLEQNYEFKRKALAQTPLTILRFKTDFIVLQLILLIKNHCAG